jgi:hypothetical protein
MTELLNDDWVVNFEKKDKFYRDFYKDDIYYSNIHTIYINRDQEIIQIKEESFLLSTPNIITREEMIGILKHKSVNDIKQYKLLSILKYNITLDPEDVSKYVNCNEDDLLAYDYLEDVKHIDEIRFAKSITMFQDLTDLYFIFYEKSNELVKKGNANSTKKIHMHSKHKKTIRKRYKD